MARTVSIPLSTSRAAITTFAPSFANPIAIARPIPELPPVTNATLSRRSRFMSGRLQGGVCIRGCVDPPDGFQTHDEHDEPPGTEHGNRDPESNQPIPGEGPCLEQGHHTARNEQHANPEIQVGHPTGKQ